MEQNRVDISIIIPTYQSWDSLKLCLDALSKQTLKEDFEILVINNDANNPTVPDEFKKYKFVRFLTEEKPGSYAARNKGIREAKGKKLVFTDADCIPNEDWLEQGIKTLNESGAGLVGGPVELFYKNPKKLHAAEVYDKYTGFQVEGYIKQGGCTTANWFSYKKIMEQTGLFNSRLKSNGDTELSHKISSRFGIAFAPKAVVHHPARNSYEQIITKHRRLIGGTYDRLYKEGGDLIGFRRHLVRFIYRRMRFNLKLLLIGKFKDSFAVLKVHTKMFPVLIKEYFHIKKTGVTERR